MTIAIAALPLPPVFDGYLTASGTVGVAFSYSLATTSEGASATVTDCTATGLPPGLSLDTSNDISGTPTQAGVYPVSVSATNAGGTRIATVTISVGAPATTAPITSAPQLYSSAAATAIVGTAFSYTPAATNAPASFGASNLPSGLSINTGTGAIGGTAASVPLTFSYIGLPPGITGSASDDYDAYLSGTPTASGVYPVTVTATTPGGVSASQVVTLVVSSAPPAITSAAGVAGNVGSTLSYTLSSASTISAYAASGLPPGLTFNASTDTISGTPTTVGIYAVPVSATSIAGTGSGVVTFQIAVPALGGLPIISSAAVVSCQDIAASSYYFYDPYHGGPSGAFSYAITAINLPTSFGATNLPAGLSLNPYTGTISGQPLTSGVFQVPISATNAVGTVNATLTIIATATLPSILNGLTSNGSVGTPFADETYTPNTEDDSFYYGLEYGIYTDPLTYTAAGLPPGLTMDTSTGYISGTPTRAGVYPSRYPRRIAPARAARS